MCESKSHVDSPFSPADSPAVMGHLNMLQGIINRLAGNSSSCKTWCMTLVAALLSVAGATHAPSIVSVTLVPVVVFGFVDTMYLAQERAYRELYNELVEKVHSRTYQVKDTFCAKAPLKLKGTLKVLGSWAIAPIYGGLIALYFVAQCRGWLVVFGSHQ